MHNEIMESTSQQLGKMLNVKIFKKKKRIAVEEANWEHILTAIENQVNDSYKERKQRKHIVSPLIKKDPEKYRQERAKEKEKNQDPLEKKQGSN